MLLKEIVTVPGALLADTAALAPYFLESAGDVAGLKPKASVKSKRKI